MAVEDVVARLSLQGQKLFSAQARTAATDVRAIGTASETTAKKAGLLRRATKVAMLGVGAAVAIGAKISVDAWKAVDEGQDAIRVGTGATGKALEGLGQSMNNVAGRVAADFPRVGQAIADINTRTGQTGKGLEGLARQFINLENVTGEAASTTIPAVTRVFGDWAIAAEDQAATLDHLFKVSQATGVGVASLGEQAVKYGAPMRQLGFSFEETTALLGKFEKEGVNSGLVMGSMRIALGKFAKEGEPAVKTLGRLTEDIAKAGSASDANALALEYFGARAGPDMAAAIREGRFEVEGLMKDLAKNPETINKAEKATQDFAQRWQMFKNKATPAFAKFGQKVMDFADWMLKNLPKAWKKLSDGFRTVTDFMKRNETAIKVVAGVWAAVMIPVWVKAGIVATISAAKQVAAWAMTKGAAIGSAWASAASAATIVAKWAWMGVKSLLHAAKVAAAWLIAMGPIGLVIAAVVAVGLIIWRNFDKIKKWIGDAWSWVKDKTGAAWDWIKDKVTAVADWFRAIPDRIRTISSNMWDGIKDSFRDVINWVIRAWNNLEFSVPSATVFGKKVGGFTLGMPDIPELHRGGRVQEGGAAKIRPDEEVVFLPTSAMVAPLPESAGRIDLTAAVGAGGGGWPETIQLVVGSKVLAEVTLDEVRDQEARL